ncbi:MAG: phosphatidylserine decarboxylase [Deltaproteobacteria bacterium]|nr:phosphatidylserine decarboxylase [Deltaproteobacteria bacterium]
MDRVDSDKNISQWENNASDSNNYSSIDVFTKQPLPSEEANMSVPELVSSPSRNMTAISDEFTSSEDSYLCENTNPIAQRPTPQKAPKQQSLNPVQLRRIAEESEIFSSEINLAAGPIADQKKSLIGLEQKVQALELAATNYAIIGDEEALERVNNELETLYAKTDNEGGLVLMSAKEALRNNELGEALTQFEFLRAAIKDPENGISPEDQITASIQLNELVTQSIVSIAQEKEVHGDVENATDYYLAALEQAPDPQIAQKAIHNYLQTEEGDLYTSNTKILQLENQIENLESPSTDCSEDPDACEVDPTNLALAATKRQEIIEKKAKLHSQRNDVTEMLQAIVERGFASAPQEQRQLVLGMTLAKAGDPDRAAETYYQVWDEINASELANADNMSEEEYRDHALFKHAIAVQLTSLSYAPSLSIVDDADKPRAEESINILEESHHSLSFASDVNEAEAHNRFLLARMHLANHDTESSRQIRHAWMEQYGDSKANSFIGGLRGRVKLMEVNDVLSDPSKDLETNQTRAMRLASSIYAEYHETDSDVASNSLLMLAELARSKGNTLRWYELHEELLDKYGQENQLLAVQASLNDPDLIKLRELVPKGSNIEEIDVDDKWEGFKVALSNATDSDGETLAWMLGGGVIGGLLTGGAAPAIIVGAGAGGVTDMGLKAANHWDEVALASRLGVSNITFQQGLNRTLMLGGELALLLTSGGVGWAAGKGFQTGVGIGAKAAAKSYSPHIAAALGMTRNPEFWAKALQKGGQYANLLASAGVGSTAMYTSMEYQQAQLMSMITGKDVHMNWDSGEALHLYAMVLTFGAVGGALGLGSRFASMRGLQLSPITRGGELVGLENAAGRMVIRGGEIPKGYTVEVYDAYLRDTVILERNAAGALIYPKKFASRGSSETRLVNLRGPQGEIVSQVPGVPYGMHQLSHGGQSLGTVGHGGIFAKEAANILGGSASFYGLESTYDNFKGETAQDFGAYMWQYSKTLGLLRAGSMGADAAIQGMAPGLQRALLNMSKKTQARLKEANESFNQALDKVLEGRLGTSVFDPALAMAGGSSLPDAFFSATHEGSSGSPQEPQPNSIFPNGRQEGYQEPLPSPLSKRLLRRFVIDPLEVAITNFLDRSARSQRKWYKNLFSKILIDAFKPDLEESADFAGPDGYKRAPSWGDIFIRKLKEGARPIDALPNGSPRPGGPRPDTIVSQVDGRFAQIGEIGPEGQIIEVQDGTEVPLPPYGNGPWALFRGALDALKIKIGYGNLTTVPGPNGELVPAKILVKGISYSALDLVAGFENLAQRFYGGVFNNTYLAPHNYHRMHMPIAGELVRIIREPGRLRSVGLTVQLDSPEPVMTTNERVILEFKTPDGHPFVMVFVAAVGVSGVTTPFVDFHHSRRYWSRRSAAKQIREIYEVQEGKLIQTEGNTGGVGRLNLKRLNSQNPFWLDIGEEVGIFHMGSTVVTLFPPEMGVRFNPEIAQRGNAVRMGEPVAFIRSNTDPAVIELNEIELPSEFNKADPTYAREGQRPVQGDITGQAAVDYVTSDSFSPDSSVHYVLGRSSDGELYFRINTENNPETIQPNDPSEVIASGYFMRHSDSEYTIDNHNQDHKMPPESLTQIKKFLYERAGIHPRDIEEVAYEWPLANDSSPQVPFSAINTAVAETQTSFDESDADFAQNLPPGNPLKIRVGRDAINHVDSDSKSGGLPFLIIDPNEIRTIRQAEKTRYVFGKNSQGQYVFRTLSDTWGYHKNIASGLQDVIVAGFILRTPDGKLFINNGSSDYYKDSSNLRELRQFLATELDMPTENILMSDIMRGVLD